jgi:hypothetical protein
VFFCKTLEEEIAKHFCITAEPISNYKNDCEEEYG